VFFARTLVTGTQSDNKMNRKASVVIVYHELAVDLGSQEPHQNLFFCVDGVFADVSPQRVRGGITWRATRGTASAHSLESLFNLALLFKTRTLKNRPRRTY